MSSPPHVAILAVALIGIAGAAYLFDNTPDDPLAGVASGVAASLTVHAGVFDGATGGAAGSISAKFAPSKQPASLVPAAFGASFSPLWQSWPGSCKAITNTFVNQDDPNAVSGPSHPRLPVPTVNLKGKVTETQSGQGLADAQVNMFKNGAFSGTKTVNSYYAANPLGGANYWFTGETTAYDMSVRTTASKDGYCATNSWTLFAVSAPATGGGSTGGGSTGGSTGGGSTGGSTGGACTAIAASETGFRSFVQGRGYDPNCVPNSLYGLLWMEYVAASQNPGSGGSNTGTITVPPGSSFTSALISVTLAGDVVTKNLAQDVTLVGEMTLKTAAGKTFTRSFPATKVPASGGTIPSTMKIDIDLPKADIGTGLSVMDIRVTAASQDFGGESRAETATLKLQAETDYRGSVSISLRAASMAASVGMPNGESATRLRTLAPHASDPWG